MINCIVGTRAQIIKMAPVFREIERRGASLNLVLTGQHLETIAELVEEFEIKTEPKYLYTGPEVTGILRMLVWFFRVLARVLARRRQYFSEIEKKKTFLLVHGDTVSTLLGAIAGKLLGFRIAHIESGLRSFNLFHPFPEEITRLLVSRLADVAFCSGSWAVKNLSHSRHTCINTGNNTLLDAVRFAIAHENKFSMKIKGDYGVVSIHRFENIFNRSRLHQIIGMINRIARDHKVVFVLHPATHKKLTKWGMIEHLETIENIKLVPRMTFVPFVRLISAARFVVTDGGSNQEELSYLGVPTLLMRKVTERKEGVGGTAMLCNYEPEKVERFMAELGNHMADRKLIGETTESPSKIIVDYMLQN